MAAFRNSIHNYLSVNCLKLNHLEISCYFCVTTAYHNNHDARTLLREISKEYNGNDNRSSNSILIKNAFRIYNQQKPQERNAHIINDMLKLCDKFKYLSKASLLWNDIHALSTSHIYDSDGIILYSLLLKCNVNTNQINVDRCIQILQWMKDNDFKLRNSDMSQYFMDIRKLISKCDQDINKLQTIHSLINHDNVYVKTALINQYGKYKNGLQDALKVFHSFTKDNINSVSVNSMMTVYLDHNQSGNALRLYNTHKHIHDDRSHVLAIKACTNTKNIKLGIQIHNRLKRNQDIYLKTVLINFYGTNGMIKDGINVFNSITDKNVVSINAMMKAYIDNYDYKNAMDIYDQYSLLINDRSHVLALKACSKVNDIKRGNQISGKLKSKLDDNSNQKVLNTSIDFYGNCGQIDKAINIYHSIADNDKDTVTKNVMMNAYLKNNLGIQALSIYDEMDDLSKDNVSHLAALKACIQTNNFDKGRDIHALIMLSEHGIELQTTLMEFYGHFGDITMVETIFNSINNKNSQSVGIAMKICLENGHNKKALSVYQKFYALTNDITHVLAIKACINAPNFEFGKEIHSKISKKSSNVQLKNTLIDFYGNFNDIEAAQKIFDSIEDKDIISINSMMECFYNCQNYAECIQLFQSLHEINNNLSADAITYSIVLKACVECTAYHIGQTIIDQELQKQENKKIKNHLSVQVNQIEFYGKCGMTEELNEMLYNIKVNEYDKYCNQIVVWNALLKAFGRNGDLNKVMDIFNMMKRDTLLTPDRKTWIILLNACNHCHDLNEAENIWQYEIYDLSMKFDCHIITTLVDCFVKYGKLYEAQDLILQYEDYSNSPYEAMWTSLMNGCKQHNDKYLAQQIYLEMQNRFSTAT